MPGDFRMRKPHFVVFENTGERVLGHTRWAR